MIVNVESQTEMSGFYVIYKGSTFGEVKGNYGVSHLTEHLVCKGMDHLQDEFEASGIGWNAYTADDHICFYMTGLDRFVNKYKQEFLESLNSFNITEEEFQNEKKIVLEEYGDVFNSQSQSHALNLMRKMFDFYEPIGLREDLEELTLKDVQDFVSVQYDKPWKIINVSKHNDFVQDMEFQTEIPEKILHYDNYEDVPLEITNTYKGKSSILDSSPLIEEDFPYIKFICSMLSSGLKSPLYQEIREKRGLVYFVRCGLTQMGSNKGVISISSETSDANVEEFQNTIKMVLDNPDKYITQERFDIVKQSYEISYEKGEINRYNNINKYITDEDWQVESVLNDITLEKIREVYDKYFIFEDFYKSVDKEEFAKEFKNV